MIELHLFDRARVVLRHCAMIAPGDHMLIVGDGTVSHRIINAFCTAAHTEGARASVITYAPKIILPMSRFSLFAGMSLDHSPAEPPTPVAGALRAADVIVLLSSDLTLYFSDALKSALAAKKRMISSVYINEENMLRLFPENKKEVDELAALTQAVGKVLEPEGMVRFTSAQGTDFECKFGQYGLKCSGGRIAEASQAPGKRFLAEFIPGGQVTRVPDDGSARGILVLDRSIAGREFRELTAPIRIEVDNGSVKNISGEWEAEDLKHFLEEFADEKMFHITEVGLGTNHRCIRCGVAAPAEDTHRSGSITFALGCDVHLGGNTRAPAHIDCTTHMGNFQFNGIDVVRNGRIVV